MNVEVLVATMNQSDDSILDRMNISSNAIIANQSDNYSCKTIYYRDNRIKFLTFNERGVGLNRNNALMRATAEYCIIADDDLVYVDNYVDLLLKAFNDNPSADIILFNLIEKKPSRYIIKEKEIVTWRNYMRYGAARIAFKRKSITKNNIFFNIHFGGGTEHSAGEDVLFLTECLRKKLKIVALPIYLAHLSEGRDSTWFEGYTDKYFKDKGVLFYYISKRWAKLLCLQFCYRRKNMFKKDKSILEALKLTLEGIQEEKRL